MQHLDQTVVSVEAFVGRGVADGDGYLVQAAVYDVNLFVNLLGKSKLFFERLHICGKIAVLKETYLVQFLFAAV